MGLRGSRIVLSKCADESDLACFRVGNEEAVGSLAGEGVPESVAELESLTVFREFDVLRGGEELRVVGQHRVEVLFDVAVEAGSVALLSHSGGRTKEEKEGIASILEDRREFYHAR